RVRDHGRRVRRRRPRRAGPRPGRRARPAHPGDPGVRRGPARGGVSRRADTPRPGADDHPSAAAMLVSMARTIDEILEEARDRLVRVTPEQAHAEMRDGALLVDIRPAAQRAAEGEVPGALIVERNVLEWRLDPASDARLPEATGHDLRVIVLCSEGYTSSLAAASLHDLGLTRATDVIGGFKAWRAAGLPATGGTDA